MCLATALHPRVAQCCSLTHAFPSTTKALHPGQPEQEHMPLLVTGGPLRVGFQQAEVALPDGTIRPRLRMTCNGRPILPEQVDAMLDLGHRGRAFHTAPAEPHAPASDAGLGPGPVPQEPQDLSIYGLYGHGTFLSIGHLAYHAFWLGW